MEILKTKIAIMDSGLMSVPKSEMEILTNSAKHRIELPKGMSGKQTVVDG